jgi:DNA polymerase I
VKKLYLVDGMSLVFRAYHAMSSSGLKSPKGEPTSAVFAFTNILTALLEKEKPEMLVVVFDTSAPTFRHVRYPLYKANRPAFPEDLVPQLAKIKQLLDVLNIKRIELAGYEADDIIGTFAKKAAAHKHEVICLTSDKDFYQLVDDKIKLYKPAPKSNEDFEVVDISGVEKKFGVRPEQVIDVLALIGDQSDNIPGVKGIGEKTAIPLIQRFFSVEGVYDNIDKIDSASVRKKLESDHESALLAKELVTILTEVPLNIDLDEFIIREPDYSSLDSLFAELGFHQMRKRWNEKKLKRNFNPSPESPIIEPEKETQLSPEFSIFKDESLVLSSIRHDYFLVDSIHKLSDMIGELSNCNIIAVDTETSSLDRNTCDIVGISLCGEEGRAFYIPMIEEFVPDELFENVKIEETEPLSLFENFTNKENNPEGLFNRPQPKRDYPKIITFLQPLLEDPKIGKCGQNIKFDAYILQRYGIEVAPIVFDSMVASYLLNPDSQHGLDPLAKQWLNYTTIHITELIGEKKATQLSMKQIKPENIKDYACEDADVAFKLRNKLYPELKKENLLELGENIEFPLIEVLIQMESNGVAIDIEALKDILNKIITSSAELKENIFRKAGSTFNIDSPKQLGTVLFEKMMIPVIKMNKTGYSTDIQVLEQLEASYPIARMILDYRQLAKLKSTYVDAIPKLINPHTGRIHTTFNQTVASTGRLSSTDPNLQNIPIRTDLGKEIRRAFVPQKPNEYILSADYSQIELRIMAFYCQDKHLIEAFQKGLDIHSATASILFDCSLDDVTPDKRRIAKTVNFGIMYGLGSFGLAQRLGISRTEAKNIIDNYFEKYPGIRHYIDETIAKAHKNGYTETLCNRRRYYPNINSKNNNLKTADERAAINMPIQGTASDMMKIAMIRICNELKNRKIRSLMTIQVHDELVFEVHPSEIEDLKHLVKHEMEHALTLGDIPVVVDVGIGKNWFEAH